MAGLSPNLEELAAPVLVAAYRDVGRFHQQKLSSELPYFVKWPSRRRCPLVRNPLHIARILLASVLRLMQRQILIVYESGSPSGIKCHALLSRLIVV
jgi:hypothetical protein